MDELQIATNTYTRLSINLDKLLKAEQTAKLVLLEKESKIRKEYFPKLTLKEISVAYFDEVIKNESFDETVDFVKCKTSRIIGQNQMNAAKEVLYSLKTKLKLI